MNETMKRWTIPALGLDRLALGVAPRTVPKAGEILVEIEAVSLNFRDAEIVENGMGVPLTFPFTPASEMGGRGGAGRAPPAYIGRGVCVSVRVSRWMDR